MSINIKNCSLICKQGSGNFNEDIVGNSPHGIWVLDGATGLNNKNLVSKESDAKWYVSWWNEYLHKNLNRKDTLEDIVVEGIDKIYKDYMELINNQEVKSIDFPSASCAIMKFNEDKIEYLIMGDCKIFIENKNNIEIIQDSKISKLDEIVCNIIKDIKDGQNLTLKEKKDKVMDMLINNRLKKNTENGYWSLEFSKEAGRKCLKGEIPLEDDMKIMITSDGFSCACDKYNICKSEAMIEMAENKGIDYIYKKVRELESLDERANKYPRFKINDDSSCIYLEVYK